MLVLSPSSTDSCQVPEGLWRAAEARVDLDLAEQPRPDPCSVQPVQAGMV